MEKVSRAELPQSLKIVAGLFVFGGICSVIEVIVSLLHSHLNLNVGVLAIPAGFGLLRLSKGWRTCSLVFLWIELIVIPLAIAAVIAGAGPIKWKIFGREFGKAPLEAALILAVVIFALALWQYRVLTRPDIRLLFGLPAKAD